MAKKKSNNWYVWAIAIVTVLILFNQYQLSSLSKSINSVTGASTGGSFGGSIALEDVDVNEIQSTAQAIAAVFPELHEGGDVIQTMIPTGTPEYGEAMGVSFDDPVKALGDLAKGYNALNEQAKQDPEVWERYLNLASKPRGISCEFCCGIGAIGVSPDGRSRCGCSHNPGILAITQWLLMNTDMSDAEILREAMKWKTIWFPKNMIGLASKIQGGDDSVLEDLPGMVGGC